MTELELRVNGRTHMVRVTEGVSLESALTLLKTWDRDWRRAKRKAAQ